MNTYIKFLTYTFYKSLFFVFFVMGSLVYILNLLSELDFFKDINIEIYFPLFLSLLNSPAMLFEMLPFIFLITTQLFFIKLFNNNEIEVFKYSGLKNTKIILILSIISILTGLFASTLFYNFSSNFKNIYLKLKSQYTADGKYLAVITKNGLRIKHIANKKNWRMVELINGYYQTEYQDLKNQNVWNDVTRRETLKQAEDAIDETVAYYSKKVEFLNGPKVVKTFK